MAEVERHPRRCLVQPPAEQGQMEQVGLGCVQSGFQYLQEWRLHNLSGQPVPLLSHPLRKKVFASTQTEPPVSQSVPIASGSVTGHH